MAKKRVPKHIAPSLRNLNRDNQRIRFHGGPLGESEVDRTIAEWLDELPARDAWPIVKTVLYGWITGRMNGNIQAPQLDAKEIGEVEQAFLEFDD